MNTRTNPYRLKDRSRARLERKCEFYGIDKAKILEVNSSCPVNGGKTYVVEND